LTSALLKVCNVTKKFGGLLALHDISFEVHKGEMLGVIGPNGSGKTTLFNVINGIYAPEAGKVFFDGRDITGLAPHRICRLGLARVYQIPQPFWNMTVTENLLVAARHGAQLSKSEAKELVAGILESVGLSEKENLLAKELLLFDLKRLELARALAIKPKLILIDELASGLDEIAIKELLELVKRINNQGVTIILVEHDIEVLVKVVNRMMMLYKGEKVMEGDPLSVVNSEIVISTYLR
jgi:branched-chain amino acid transport system ATP-binding protein